VTRLLANLRGDSRGVTAIEFGLISPVLVVMLLGLMDLGYNLWTAELLDGAIQKAARDSTLEGADKEVTSIDDRVKRAVLNIAPAATFDFQRTAYPSFSAAGKPEDFTDTNANNRCDNNEPYEDVNENSRWDTDQGRVGAIGSSRDVVVYKVSVTYPRPFAAAAMLGQSSTFQIQTETILSNQPWDNVPRTPPVRNCR
jgi:Flp pilus assembly protein TadG